jgi:TolB-like protein/class 3 adenylate cyclase/Tfp pilus assembly protein PilF
MSSSRQLAAIMFTDIVGYTEMMQANEHRATTLIKHYHTVLEKWVNHFNGRIVNDYGDGSLSIFSSATDAVNCSIEIQKELRIEPKVPLRIGLHIGEIFFEEDKALGDGVNVASRIQSLGQENTILVSAEIHDKIRNNPTIRTSSLGHFDFKHVYKPMEVYALTNDDLYVPQRKNLTGKLKSKSAIKQKIILGFSAVLLITIFYFAYSKLGSHKEIADVEKSIAVLPFTDMSQNRDQEFFSDGLTEDIITQLAKISAFKVTSRTSVMQYKNNSKSLKEIGNELNAAHILEGSVQMSGDKVRITAQLINAETDEHLWADSYDRSMNDIFSIQTDIATKIADALKAKLSTQEKQHLEKKYTDNSEAYQLYLQGRYFWNQRLEGPVRKSIEFFKQAIAKDSTYALAYAGLGDAYLMLGVYSVLRPDESFPLAKSYAEKALQLDPTLAEAYSTLIDINIHYYWDMDAADHYFQKAIDVNPQYANAYHWHSEVLIIRRKFDDAIRETLAALDIEPYSPIINTQLGIDYIYKGDLTKAVDILKKTLAYDSTFSIAHYRIGTAYLGLKQYDQAQHHLLTATKLAPGNNRFLSTLAYAESLAGQKEEVIKIQHEFLTQKKTKYVPAYDLAVMSLASGEEKAALQYLEVAYTEHEPWMPFIGFNLIFSSLYDDKEFQDLVKKIEQPSRQ